MTKKYVFDSYAVLCYLQDEPGADTVYRLLMEADNNQSQLIMTWVNAGEVYYRIWREYGKQDAEKALSLLMSWPIDFLAGDEHLTLAAAAVKAEHRLSYADAFAIAAAQRISSAIVTGDPEILQAKARLGFDLLWLPEVQC